ERVVVAYEPVWAIGSGLTPTPTDIAEMHGFIRRRLVSRFGAEGAGHPHPLRRIGEALERQGAAGGCQRRGPAGRRREPQGGRVPGDRGRLSLRRCRGGGAIATYLKGPPLLFLALETVSRML